MEKYNIYRLLNNRRPASWQLPLTEVLIQKIVDGKDEGLKSIKYVKGVNSFFAEDIKGEAKPVQIWFSKGELSVLKIDKLTNSLLQAHPWFNKHYELYSESEESKKKLKVYRTQAEARKLIDESDEQKINAIALAIFGQAAFNWDPETCELQLREYAELKPEKLQKELSSKDYESKYIAALAISKGIITTNPTKSDVIWNDTTKGVILRLAKGETAIGKLGEFLATRTDESERVLQEIGIRVEKLEVGEAKEIAPDVKKALSEKDKEIAALKAQLLASKKIDPIGETLTLEDATLKYIDEHEKEPPARYKNDLSWITSKLK